MNDSAVQTYNGWSNRETWLASLWLNNDQVSYDLLLAACKRRGESFEKADWLERCMRTVLEELFAGSSLWNDLIGTAFNRINWLEVIENN
jgi:hypothetical protein